MKKSPPTHTDALRHAITEEEARLQHLEHTRQATQARLDSLKAELASLDADPPTRVERSGVPTPSAPPTPAEKVALFRHMKSYDRLFPNQDTLPRGGFGNLIALPFQHEPRQHGNTVFLDERFEPYPDQWTFLASVPRIDPATVDLIANNAMRQGRRDRRANGRRVGQRR